MRHEPVRVDANQKDIVATLRAAGASVQSLAAVGAGCPDLVVGFRGVNYLLEVKDGAQPPNKRNLTAYEASWHVGWRGQVSVVESVEDALAACGIEVRR